MKKIAVLILLLAVIATGCSYEVTVRNSQELQGESENWKVEYWMDFATNYPQKDGKIYAERMDRKKMIVTYKNDLANLSDVRHMEISYKDSFGGGGKRTEDLDSPPTEKQFQLGRSGSSTIHEAGNYTETLGKLRNYIMIFSGPGGETRANASADVIIKTDNGTEAIRLLPVRDPSPIPGLLEQINNKLSEKPFLRFFSGRASDMSLKLESFDVRVAQTTLQYEFVIRNEGRKPISGSLNDLQVIIVPNENLREVSKETFGIDLYDPDSSFGYGQSIDGNIFYLHKDCDISLSFDLSTESPEAWHIDPSAEKLDKLLDNASDASLVIIYKDEEAARFDLNIENR